MKPKFITIINDCKSENDKGRQMTRYSCLFPGININFVGVDSSLGINATLEAAGNLIDILDACSGQPGIIAMNVAPRGQIKEDGKNGSRFSYFLYGQTLIVTTIKNYNLSLVKKLGVVNKINILETNDVMDFASSHNLISHDLAEYIKNTQFRSFDYQPRVAKWLFDNIDLPHTPTGIEKFADIPNAVWFIDSFGNAKTTLLKEDVFINKQSNTPDQLIHTNFGKFKYYSRLKDIPDGETAIYSGSSGINDKRFLEIATQNTAGSAAKKLDLNVGYQIEVL